MMLEQLDNQWYTYNYIFLPIPSASPMPSAASSTSISTFIQFILNLNSWEVPAWPTSWFWPFFLLIVWVGSWISWHVGVAQPVSKCCSCFSAAGTGHVVWTDARQCHKQCTAPHCYLLGVWDGQRPTQPRGPPTRLSHDKTQGLPLLPSGLQEALPGESLVGDAAEECYSCFIVNYIGIASKL